MGWAPFSTTANWTVKFFCQPFFLSTGKSSAQESASKILCLRSGLLEWPVYSKFWQNFDKIVYSVLIFIEVSIQFFFSFWAFVSLLQSLQRGRPPTPRCPLCNRFGFLNFGLLACLDHFARISFAFEIIFRN